MQQSRNVVQMSRGLRPVRSMLHMMLAVVLAMGMVVVVPKSAFALDGPKEGAYNAASATGASDDPYRILVTSYDEGSQTRPSAFWSGTGNNAASGESSFIPFAVTFEQRSDNTTDGALVSSMSFDMHDNSGRHDGAAAVGPVLAGGSDGAGADVWSGLGIGQQASWVYAFRLAPYSEQDISTGDLRIAFAWHGCFATYFDTWEYAFDAVGATAGLSSDKQVKAGDTIALSYYGGYDVQQTSRGSSYAADFSNTSTVNTTSSALSVLGDPTTAVYEAVVGQDGIARLSGSNSIQYGGNYVVSITKRAGDNQPVQVDKTTLNSTIDQVKADSLTVVTSVDGSDVVSTQAWVNQAQLQALQDATASAEAVAANAGATQGEVDTAAAMLSSAWDVFKAQKQWGIKVVDIQKWDIGKTVTKDATATLYTDGRLVIAGKGDLATFDDASSTPWASARSSITSVVFENGVTPTSLDFYFTDCTRLISVAAIPEGVCSLVDTFRGCTSLTRIGTIPATVTDATRAFANCTSLTEIPANFSLPATARTTDIFKVELPYSADNLLETYTMSADASLASYDWAASNRKLVKSATWEIGKNNPGDVVAGLLENGTLELSGSGAMKDFASADEVPWAAQAASIQYIHVGEGVTTVGDYAFAGLSHAQLTSVKLPAGMVSIGKDAFADCKNVLVVDLTACAGTGAVALKTVGDGAFCGIAEGATVYVRDMRAAALIKSLPADVTDRTGGNVDRVTTALAVANEGSLPEGAVGVPRQLVSSLEKSEYDFVKWTTDASLMHPATSWKALSSGTTYYAKYTKSSVITGEPSVYPGYQGLDQFIQLVDLLKLPGTVSKQVDIESYGSNSEHFLNKITTPYNGNQNIVFAFNMSRGGNANGGDGAYQKSFSLPYISILDDAGNTVASYDNGSGKLKLFSTVFDGTDGKSQGNTINAFRIGVEANELPAGTYTLRFDKGLGANNGTSFLDKNVDFVFTVTAAEQYHLTYDTSGASAVVTGVQLVDGATGVDVYIPDTVDGKKVTGIADDAFKGVSGVQSVTVPDTVATVGNDAFSDMAGLAYVKMTGKEDAAGGVYDPAWGSGVFDGSANCLLYGWSQVSSVKNAAEAYGNVTYCPLEDGVYVNGVKLGDEPVALGADDATAVVSVISAAEIMTDSCKGYISNTNAVGHAGTTRGLWQNLTAKANGVVALIVRNAAGDLLAQGTIAVSGFTQDASTAHTPLAQGVYQGNGATICLMDAGALETASYDETLDAFDNYLVDSVAAEGATFALALGGPGSAWDSTRWDWDDWTANHLNDYVWVEDESGAQIATVGNGLSWTKLRGSNGTDNTVVLSVDPGVLGVGKTYTLVASAEMAGHNVAARLMKDVRWTFVTKAANIETATIAAIPDQTYRGAALEPEVNVTVPVLETTLWDESTEQPVVTPASTRTLVKGTDYRVTYENNNALGTGKAIIEGMGGYAGSAKTVEFAIVAGPGDLSALKQAIKTAQAEVEKVVPSADGKDVVSGTLWASASSIEAANKAIAAAQIVADRSDATEGDIAKARTDLTSAMAAFTAATEIARVNTAALTAGIDEATSDLNSALVDTDATKVAQGALWVTQQNHDAFASAIADAQAVLGNGQATQNELDKALATLNAAKVAFDASKQEGTKAAEANTNTNVGQSSSDKPSSSASSVEKALVATGDTAGTATTGLVAIALGAIATVCLAARRRQA